MPINTLNVTVKNVQVYDISCYFYIELFTLTILRWVTIL